MHFDLQEYMPLFLFMGLFKISAITAFMLLAPPVLFSQDRDSLGRKEAELRRDILSLSERMRKDGVISLSRRDSIVLMVSPAGDGTILNLDDLEMLRDLLEEQYSVEQSSLSEEFFQNWNNLKENMMPKTLSVPGNDYRIENDGPMKKGPGRSPGDDETVRWNSIEQLPYLKDTIPAKTGRFLRWLSRFTGGSVSVDNPFGGVYNPAVLHIPEPPGRPLGLDQRMFEDTLRFDPHVYKPSTITPFRVKASDRKAFEKSQIEKKEAAKRKEEALKKEEDAENEAERPTG